MITITNREITTIYIDGHLKNLAKIKGINISKITEEALNFHLNMSKGTEELEEKKLKLRQEIEIIDNTLQKYRKVETPEFKEKVKEIALKLANLTQEHSDWRKFLQPNCDVIFNTTGISISPMALEQEVLYQLKEVKT